MEGLLERIGKARTQVRQLQAVRDRLRVATVAAEGRAREAAREKEVLTARIKELEQENEVLRKAAAPPGAPGREGTKERIDELMKEIDQCLALMNS
ncbi:MAG: hypothetical protein KBF80_10760 [Flavobacteriales bacterium]|nr:hypothetical protein [Flavobacteriales bacterium]